MSILGQRSHPGPNPAHTSPPAALTSEDKEPERCFQRGEQHGGLHSWMARSCQEQSRMSTALPAERAPTSTLCRGALSPQLSPRLTSPPQKLLISFQFSALPSQEGGRFPTELDLQEELFLKHLPRVNRDFARGSRSCVSSRSSLLEMPLPSLQSPPFLPLSVPLPAFFSFFLVFHFPQSQ